MDHQDLELADVVVVLNENSGTSMDDAVKQLKSLGLAVDDSDADNCVIEGTIEAAKVKELNKLPFVNYVRKVFEYVADFPAGDPRNNDRNDDGDLPDVDDAGA